MDRSRTVSQSRSNGGNGGAAGYTGTTELSSHISYNTDLSATNFPTADFDTVFGNQFDSDPRFNNVGSDDYTLLAHSPAVAGVATLDPAYDAFQTLYGISIKTDIAGNPIPDTNASSGAYQKSATEYDFDTDLSAFSLYSNLGSADLTFSATGGRYVADLNTNPSNDTEWIAVIVTGKHLKMH